MCAQDLVTRSELMTFVLMVITKRPKFWQSSDALFEHICVNILFPLKGTNTHKPSRPNDHESEKVGKSHISFRMKRDYDFHRQLFVKRRDE